MADTDDIPDAFPDVTPTTSRTPYVPDRSPSPVPDPITVSSNGASLTFCAPHALELCPICCLDFTEMNRTERERARLRKSRKAHGVSLGRGLLKAGSRVRMLPAEGNVGGEVLDGEVVDVKQETDRFSEAFGLRCYVVELEGKGAEMIKVPIDDVHDEWLVANESGEYVKVQEVVPGAL
ncbi:hypothetical protein BJ742DRAFT_793228 [Cladochytrium replicatum]|nr:hypothetical protein BJ742DRAFT_793228 [Cladochytrium replicatum]